MKILGQILLWVGFLTGSLATVYQYKGSSPELTVPLTWFAISAAIGFLGVAILWVQKLRRQDDEITSTSEFTNLADSIGRLVQSSQSLNQSHAKLAPSEIVAAIDESTEKDFQLFADNRKVLIGKSGLQSYAAVMTQFSAAERAMNRAWSAAADGYVDEVDNCLQKSQTHLVATEDLIREIGKV